MPKLLSPPPDWTIAPPAQPQIPATCPIDMLALSPQVVALPKRKQQALVDAARASDPFAPTEAVRWTGVSDFGFLTLDDRDYVWELQYSDRHLRQRFAHPAVAACTTRILAIQRTDEY